MALGILICIYIAIFGIVLGLIVGVAIGVLKLIGYACIGLFLGAFWVVEMLVKCILLPFRRMTG